MKTTKWGFICATKCDMPEASGLSAQNLKYCGYFYRLYSLNEANPQVVDFSGGTSPQDFNKNAVTNASVDLNQQILGNFSAIR